MKRKCLLNSLKEEMRYILGYSIVIFIVYGYWLYQKDVSFWYILLFLIVIVILDIILYFNIYKKNLKDEQKEL